MQGHTGIQRRGDERVTQRVRPDPPRDPGADAMAGLHFHKLPSAGDARRLAHGDQPATDVSSGVTGNPILDLIMIDAQFRDARV
jgi:hypothetical protein